MLSQVMTNQVSQKRVIQKDLADKSRIREFLRINPPNFIVLSVNKDSKNFMEEL